MTLYRCSVPKKRNSQKFLDLEEVYAVGEVLEKLVWFDHYSRSGGISSEGVSRFGPNGFAKWPLYASEKDDTTYYEFSYWKLKDWKEEQGMQTRASLLKFDFKPSTKPIDIETLDDKDQILDKGTYSHSHQWINSLDSIPESLVYPSVRDPNTGGLNFSIYEGNTVSNISLVQDVIMTVLDSDNVEVIFQDNTKVTVRPIK